MGGPNSGRRPSADTIVKRMSAPPRTSDFPVAGMILPNFQGLKKGLKKTDGAFTKGSVLFADAEGGFTEDNANLFWDDANNRLGLGTSSPTGKFHVVGDADVIQSIIKANSTQTANLQEFQDSSGNVLAGLDERGIMFSDGGTSSLNFFAGEDAGNIAADAAAIDNVAIGANSLTALTTGISNTAIGSRTLLVCTEGSFNVALGKNALDSLTTGDSNFGLGNSTLQKITTPNGNVAIGAAVGDALTTGAENVFIGNSVAFFNVTGDDNVAIGQRAGTGASGQSWSKNVLIGARSGNAVTTGSNNILLGWHAGDNLTTGANNIVLGHDIDAVAATSANTLNIGNFIFATGIDGTGTTISDGKLGIGTASPAVQLEIESNSPRFNLSNTDSSKVWQIQNDNSPEGLKFVNVTDSITSLFLKTTGEVGIGTTSPITTLDVDGGFATNIVAKTANYTATTSDDMITCGAGNESFTITLPAVSGVTGLILTIKNVGTGTITVDGDGTETIDGATTAVISTQFDSVTVQCDGTVWHVK